MDPWVRLALRAQRGRRVLLDLRAQWDLRDLRVRSGHKVKRALLDPRAPPDLKVRPAHRARKACKDLRVPLGQPGPVWSSSRRAARANSSMPWTGSRVTQP